MKVIHPPPPVMYMYKKEKKNMAVVELNKQAKPQYKFVPFIGEHVADLCSLLDFTGSRVICNPPPMDTDIDILVYVNIENWGKFIKTCHKDGWKEGGSKSTAMDSVSYKMKRPIGGKIEEVNIIATATLMNYNDFMLATMTAKALNLTNKDQRILLFKAMMTGEVDGYEDKKDPDLATWHGKKPKGLSNFYTGTALDPSFSMSQMNISPLAAGTAGAVNPTPMPSQMAAAQTWLAELEAAVESFSPEDDNA